MKQSDSVNIMINHSEAVIQIHVAELLHDELGVVMAKTWQQLSGSPLQEVVEGVGRTLLHLDLITVAPDLQAGQCNPHIQRPVELKQTEEVGSVLLLQHTLTG